MQIIFGLLCASDGCPVAVEVFEGNTGDPSTLATQVAKLKQRFRLDHVVLVGDRGMITETRVETLLKPAGLDWITALRAPTIRTLLGFEGKSLPHVWQRHSAGSRRTRALAALTARRHASPQMTARGG